MDSIRVSEAPDTGSIPVEATVFRFYGPQNHLRKIKFLTMATSNKELWQQINDAFERKDMNFYEAHLADDIQWKILGEKSPVKGKKDYLEVLKMQSLESFPEITVLNIIAEGDYVVVESIGRSTTKKGEPYNQSYCEIYRFKDEKIQEITTYLDTALSNETD